MTNLKRRPFVVGPYYEDYEGKQQFLRDIFDRIAPHYEGIAKWGWLCAGDRYRRKALKRAGFQHHMQVVDVASGTGQVTRALLNLVDRPDQITCIEPSAGMIAESRKTVPCVHYQGVAENLPVQAECFDFMTMGFALRHVDDIEGTFREFRRVLKPTGKVLLLEVTLPRHFIGRRLLRTYFKHVLPWFTLLFSRDPNAKRLMDYYWQTMDQMVSSEEVVQCLHDAGFRDVSHRLVLGCFSEYEAIR